MTVCTACIGEARAQGVSKGGPEPKPLPYEVEVTSASSGLRSALQAGEFGFALDAGRALGGEQSAASPVQAFIASIVACTQVWGLVHTVFLTSQNCVGVLSVCSGCGQVEP